MKWLVTILSMLSVMVAGAAEWIPADRPAVAFPPPIPLHDLRVATPDGVVFRPAEMEHGTSLNGEWKFSGLQSSSDPFAAPDAEELKQAAPGFDDGSWKQIRVPLNWYQVPENACSKILKYGTYRDAATAGGGDTRKVLNPYFKGWYRHGFELPDPLPSGRIQLDFDFIGYEAELFVNGKYAGRHHGDFVPFRAGITEFAKPGKNLIALRVLSDFGPKDGKYTRTYGAMWDPSCFKGGIWGNVRLTVRPERDIDRMLLTTDPATGKLRLDYSVTNFGKESAPLLPGVSVMDARSGKTLGIKEFPAVILKPGANTGTLELQVANVRPWTPDEPNLYFGTLYFRRDREIASARTERFGFRDFKTAGTGFRLNGKPVYLIFESAHPVRFGGYATPDGNRIDPRAVIAGFRAKGYNMLRTAHMPISKEFLDLADELGMMIYDEWSCAFLTGIDEKAFEANNLPELKQFVLRDYNHPSVVMWTLGNEVKHKLDPGLVRQLNKQTALVRQLDLQKRPICAFAGIGNVDSYGCAKLDTDLIDLHLYTGINIPWTHWNWHFQLYHDFCSDIYGNGKPYEMPTVISECVGGGWGMRSDPSFKLGDIDRYLKEITGPYTWGSPGAAGYSGSIGVAAALDSKRGYRYLQNRIGSRILELIREEPRIAGFAPWTAVHDMKNASGWTQPVYPGLRLPGAGGIAPRQLPTPGTLDLEAFVLNQNGGKYSEPRLVVELAADGKIHRLAELTLAPLKPGDRVSRKVSAELPEASGVGELRLTLYDGRNEIGRNGYEVTLHSLRDAAKPVAAAGPVALLAPDANVERVLKELAIPFERVKTPEALAKFKRAVLPLREEWRDAYGKELRRWVQNGGVLLALEPGLTVIPGFPEYRVSALGNTLVEAVIPEHPVFRGLSFDDLDVWAENPNGFPFEFALVPLNGTALAVKGALFSEPSLGVAVAEATVGKGRILLSTLNALPLWRRNGAATRYLRNLFAYVAEEGPFYDARPLPEGTGRNAFFLPKERVRVIDLKPFVNRGFADEKSDDRQGGWTDQGGNDFHNIPLGMQTAAGVPFEIIDPAGNGGTSCLILRNVQRPYFPEKSEPVPVGETVAGIYFLHTAAWVGGVECGHYRITYADGTHVDYPLACGVNIGDWWNPTELPEALPGFCVKNRMDKIIGLFVAFWRNPFPQKPVRSFELIPDKSDRAALPILVAVTAELANPEPLAVFAPSNSKVKWGAAAENNGVPPKIGLVPLNAAKTQWATRLEFAECRDGEVPCALLFFDRTGLTKKHYDYLAFRYRAAGAGVLDLVLPQSDWRSFRYYTLMLENTKDEWKEARLVLNRDFTTVGVPFEIGDMRGEIAFYNGKVREAGFPRRAVGLEISDIRFE